jgi:hypothetical protein
MPGGFIKPDQFVEAVHNSLTEAPQRHGGDGAHAH